MIDTHIYIHHITYIVIIDIGRKKTITNMTIKAKLKENEKQTLTSIDIFY